MTLLPAAPSSVVLAAFENPWRDDMPVFACCRKAVAAAVGSVDLLDLATRDVTARVNGLREAAARELPGHLDTHRCCAGHLADLAFDLPDLLAPAEH